MTKPQVVTLESGQFPEIVDRNCKTVPIQVSIDVTRSCPHLRDRKERRQPIERMILSYAKSDKGRLVRIGLIQGEQHRGSSRMFYVDKLKQETEGANFVQLVNLTGLSAEQLTKLIMDHSPS